MKLNTNTPLEIISTNSNANRGWKEISYSRVFPNWYTTTPAIRITCATGNPTIMFITYCEQSINQNSGDSWRSINFFYGWRVNPDGSVDNPTGNGAAAGNGFNFCWQCSNGLDWSYWTTASRSLTFNAQSSSASDITVQLKVSVYTDRWDYLSLATL